ncbi:MAG TPA: hypothetical protein VHW60_23225 [Caulobacteraceae bacterium]|jgi:hypothetical protein|nr:hypothetical protein [Caulobacteraceae bacterium]
MQFKTIAAVVAAASFAVLAPTMASAAPQDFQLDNETGYTIKNLYISPTTTNDWQDDVLGQDTLDTGAALNIHFPGGRGETCEWDLKIAYNDDSSHEWTSVNLCSINKVTIHYDEGTQTTSATSE